MYFDRIISEKKDYFSCVTDGEFGNLTRFFFV